MAIAHYMATGSVSVAAGWVWRCGKAGRGREDVGVVEFGAKDVF